MDLDTYHNLSRIWIHPKISVGYNPKNPYQCQATGSGYHHFISWIRLPTKSPAVPGSFTKSWSESELLLNRDPSPYFILIQILGLLPKNPSWIRMDLDTYHNLIRICIHPKISAWSNPQNPNQYQISGSGSSQKSYRNTESGYQILTRIKFPAGSYLKS